MSIENSIYELDFHELEEVSGGILPLIPAAIVVGCFVGGAATGFALVGIAEAIW